MIVWMLLITAAATAQDTSAVRIERVTGGGFGFVRAGDWGLVRAKVVNERGEPVEVTLEVHDPRSATLQFARRVWLPANSARLVDVPVQVDRGPKKGLGVELRATLEGVDGRRVGAEQTGVVLFRERGEATTAVLADDDREGEARAAVSAVREAAALGPTLYSVRPRDLPTDDAAYGGLDTLVLATREPLPPEAVPALRRWLAGGGRLWVMLDRVDPDAAGRVVGPAWDVAVVGEVELPEATPVTGEGEAKGEVPPREGREMLRVLAPGMQTLLAINGWPAALRAQVGDGEVLVTTLDAESWSDIGNGNKKAAALQSLTPTLRHPAVRVDPHQAAVRAAVASYLERQIGYEVLGRWPVAMVFAALLLWLTVSGFVAWRRRRGEWSAAAGVAGALAAAGVLVVLGRVQRGQTPTTLAELRLERVLPNTPHVQSVASGAVYLADADAGRPPRVRGTGAMPVVGEARPGALQRIVFDGAGGWELATLALPPGGVVTFEAGGVSDLVRQPEAVVRLAGEGLVGELHDGTWSGLDDALIVGGGGRVAARVIEDGRVTVGVQGMERNRFVDAATLTPEDVARRDVLRAVLGEGGRWATDASGDGGMREAGPALVGWTRDEQTAATGGSLSLGDGRGGAVIASTAVVAVPLRVQPPGAGERVTLPGALLGVEAARREGERAAVPYDESRGEWLDDLGRPATLLQRWSLPSGVAGRVDIESVELTLELDAAGWSPVVVVQRGGRLMEVDAEVAASGRTVVTLEGDTLPDVAEGGGFTAGVRVTGGAGGLDARPWTLRGMAARVMVRGE